MYIKKYYKSFALTVCALLLSLSVYGSYTVPVKAATIDPPFTQLLDIALSKVGISANLTTLAELENMYLAGLNEIYTQYKVYLESNNRADTEDSFLDFCQINSELDVLQMLDFLTYKELYHPEFLPALGGASFSTMVIQYLKDKFCVSDGENYVVPDTVVDGNKKVFDDMIDDLSGYYYVRTLSPNDLLASYFGSVSDYNNFVLYINSSDNVTTLITSTTHSGNDGSFTGDYIRYTLDNVAEYYIVKPYSVSSTTSIDLYDDNAALYPVKHTDTGFNNTWYVPFHDYETFLLDANSTTSTWSPCVIYGAYDYTAYPFSGQSWFLFTKDGHKIKVYKTRDDLINALGGTPKYDYYINSTYDYSSTTDNSITVGRDYFMNNNGTYSYDTITENIANTDNSYTNIDNSMNQIVNNYYGSSSGGGSGDGSGDGSGSGSDDGEGGFWDAMTKIIDGIGDFFNFLLTLIGELITLFTTFLNQIMDLVGSFAGVGGDFVLFMSEFFVFVPQQIWDVITLGVTASIAIAIYKFFVK